MNPDTKIRRITALLEDNFRELAKLDAAEAFGKKIDEVVFASLTTGSMSTAPDVPHVFAKQLEALRQQAVIDRVTDKLCPPEPVHDSLLDGMRYVYGAFAPTIKRPSDVLLINSVA